MTPKTTPRDLFAGMNKTEKAFAMQLEARKRTGEIAEWWYERVTFKLGDDCRYTPDFCVIHSDGRITLEETKGHWRDDAKVKVRAFAQQFPFPIRAHVLKGGVWTVEDFTNPPLPVPDADP